MKRFPSTNGATCLYVVAGGRNVFKRPISSTRLATRRRRLASEVLVANSTGDLGGYTSPQFIRTAHGVGYAFCGEATDLGSRGRGHAEPTTRCWLVWENRTFVLSAGDNVIGRDPGCHVWLDHAGVSRRHARIRIPDDMPTLRSG